MFGKLKDKLKKSLSIFSRKTEEVAEEKEVVEEIIEEEKELPSAEELVEESKEDEEVKAEIVEEKKKPEEEKKKIIAEKKVIKIKKEEKKKEEKKEQKKKEEAVVSKKEVKKTVSEEKEEEKQKPSVLSAEEIVEEVEEEDKAQEEVIKESKKKEEKREVVKEEKVVKVRKEEKKKEDVTEVEEEQKKSFFGKLKQTFTTKTVSAEKFDELFWDLEVILLENNVSMEVIEKIKEDLKKELVDKPLPRDVLKKIEETLQKTIKEILTFEKVNLIKKAKEKKPLVIAFFGINGTGKTTSIAKLTHYFQQQKLSVVLAACDTFRAAAIQQLEEHADKLGVKMIKHDYGSDAAAVAFDAIRYAEKNGIDVVMIDTAGRLHSNTNLMAELEKIIRVTNPDLKIFVGESITGNDCIEQARRFNELVEMDGAILTKVDVDEKGGAPLSISYTIGKPILFLGVGQEYKDLEEFNVDVIMERLGF
ncbi:MAG: signal recognition particle-docking protein FtsY [Nanoarchaeota archaeon]|nr:signal recognition particle-docking protein FtsY [Nanoarchaeota archaeon]MBU1644370.1 signal recognition particle-docking protein FtsY [Nanoarchaeota archaeon]MBU1977050.1 signal recognition particle-docking protein FtsY [Nanoarchaeota archaeon]